MATTNIEINGVIDTSNKVLDNINRIADAALCFVTWDLELGKWSVILQQAETSSRSFDDSNIVGSISVGGTGVDQTYTSATIRFPHKDLNSNSDFITVEVPLGDRYPNEIDNDLSLNTDLVNDPAHAQQIAAIELKNSRLDQVIQFSTDYTSLGITAGDVIDLTSAQYGFNQKQYRVITVRERDLDDGTLLIDITAKEFADVFANSLSRDDKNRETGITTPPSTNLDCICFLKYYAIEGIDVTADTDNFSETDEQFHTVLITQPVLGTTASVMGFDPDDAQYRYDPGVSFTAPRTGVYLIKWIYATPFVIQYQIGEGRYYVPDTARYKSELHYRKNGLYNRIPSTSNAVKGIDIGKFDFTRDFLFDFNEGETIDFIIRFKTDFGPNHPDVTPAPAQVGVTGRIYVYYIGEQGV